MLSRTLGWAIIGAGSVVGLLGSAMAFASGSCGPFDFRVAQAKPGYSAHSDLKDLPLAQGVAFDATNIFSEPPFYRQQTQAGKVVWGLDTKHDSKLASQMVMLEMLGYLRDYVGFNKLNSRWFLSEENMEKLNGLSSSDLAAYPYGNNAGLVIDRIRSVFGAAGDNVLHWMADRNRKAFQQNLVHYSRPVLLSSENLANKSIATACLLAGYASGIYGGDLGKKSSKEIAAGLAKQSPIERAEAHETTKHVLRSAIVDMMAAAALKAQYRGEDLNKLIVPLAANQAECRLVRDFRYSVVPTSSSSQSCTSISQPVPVVRNGPETWNDQRLVQVGSKFFEVYCWVSNRHSWVNFSDKTSRPAEGIDEFIAAIGNDPALVNSAIGKQVRDHLGHIIRPDDTTESIDFFADTAEKCSDLMGKQILHPPTPSSWAYLQDSGKTPPYHQQGTRKAYGTDATGNAMAHWQ